MTAQRLSASQQMYGRADTWWPLEREAGLRSAFRRSHWRETSKTPLHNTMGILWAQFQNVLSVSTLFIFIARDFLLLYVFCLESLMCLYQSRFLCRFGRREYQTLWFPRSSKGMPTTSPRARSCLFAQIYINLINLQPAQNPDRLDGEAIFFPEIKAERWDSRAI